MNCIWHLRVWIITLYVADSWDGPREGMQKLLHFRIRVLSQCYLIFPEHGLISLCSSTLRKGWKFLIYCFEFPLKQSSVWNKEGSTFWPGEFLEFRKLCHFNSLDMGMCFPSVWLHDENPPEVQHSCVFKLCKTQSLVTEYSLSEVLVSPSWPRFKIELEIVCHKVVRRSKYEEWAATASNPWGSYSVGCWSEMFLG